MTTKLSALFIAALIALGSAPALSFDVDKESGPIKGSLGQPPDEAALQSRLPQVRDELWRKFVNCPLGYDEETGVYSIQLTPEVKALNGKTVTMRGFVLPMDGSDQTKHFLLTRNTPVCMYCPPGQPNEVVEVEAEKPIQWSERIVAVTGKLRLVNDQERAVFFRMENARAK
ncbi:DUF3299 domain-containing protein [Reyranella sp.]|uniref:DUF3299 domain-containing protein n=1 Tax=Reyranella sp. TaxID=1929291 RepID=UPI003D10B2F0